MNALHICYQSVNEPLTRTQVIAYLEGLTADGHRVVLLTFEPEAIPPTSESLIRSELEALGIVWHWTRYHKRPSAPATAWDIAAGVAVGSRLARRYGIELYHARSHVPAVIAAALKRLKGGRFLFDMRGFMAEEYVDAGVWPAAGAMYGATKRMEARLVHSADGIVVLTEHARVTLGAWYPDAPAARAASVIPCCVDMRRFAESQADSCSQPHLVYAGKLGGWYWTEAMMDFMAAASTVMPELGLRVYTQSDPQRMRAAREAASISPERLMMSCASPADMPRQLSEASAGLCFIRPTPSKIASSPTKIGEYLAAGIPVIANPGIGDGDVVLRDADDGPVGVVVDPNVAGDLEKGAKQLKTLLSDGELPVRCRNVACERLGLATVGWPRYRQIYNELQAA